MEGLPVDVVNRIDELDRQINAICSTGFDDTSIAAAYNNDGFVNSEVLSTWISGLPNELDDTLEIKENVKSLIRVLCEGSTLNANQLSPLISKFIGNLLGEELTLPVDKLQLLIPVLLTRKALDKNDALPFYWESPYIEIFPDYYKESIRKDRKIKSGILRKYRAIVRVKESLISEECDAIDKANEALNKILKLELIEKEKMIRKKNLEELREKNEIMKESLRREKEAKRKELEAKKLQQMEEKMAKIAKTEKNVSKFNILLSWLKPQQSNEVVTDESLDEDIHNYFNQNSDAQSKKLYLQIVSELPSVNSNCCKKKLFLDITNPLSHEQIVDELEEFITTTCRKHREKWNRYISHVSSPAFEPSAPSGDGSAVQTNCGKGTISHIYLDDSLPATDTSRVFFMYDNLWKRPSMRLIVNKQSQKINGLNPLAQELSIDYSADTDDEWFEQCDFDNVDDSGSEEEDDEFEEDDWLVPDGEVDAYGVSVDNQLVNCAAIYCDCGWEWTLDGVAIVPHPMPGGFGGYYGFNDAPFNPLELSVHGKKFDISPTQEMELIQFCHGKSCSRDKLIEDIKALPILMYVPKAAINRCINKNIIRQRVGNKTTWLIAQEAVDRFKDSLALIESSAASPNSNPMQTTLVT